MKFELQKRKKRPTDSELIADVIRIAKQHRLRSVSGIEYIRYGKYAHHRFWKRFGSWMNVLKLAGLPTSRYYSIDGGADLFRNMKRVWSSLGRQPKLREMVRPFSQFEGGTYQYVFGSWKKALKWFVKLANDPKFQKKDSDPPALIKKRSKPILAIAKVSLGLRFEVLRRDNYRCLVCGRSPATHKGILLHIDHVKPLARGGKTIMRNLQTLCGDCNVGKGVRRFEN